KLPALPRYLMGVGFPEDLVAAVERGVDLFDCVAPTRNGRNGSAFTPDGPINIRNAEHREDSRPLDDSCDCETCTTFSRGYLRHLFVAEELLGLRLLSLHNVRYLIRLAEDMRAAIRRNAFGPWADAWRRRYLRSGSACPCSQCSRCSSPRPARTRRVGSPSAWSRSLPSSRSSTSCSSAPSASSRSATASCSARCSAATRS